jgi:type IV pilus assembly protein PilE
MKPLRHHRPRGFTLIEVMIVCAIVAILAVVAYPSYAEHVRAGRRAEAQRALEEASQFMRRRYSNADTHVGARIPQEMGVSPRSDPQAAAYAIVLVENGQAVGVATIAHAYTLRAVRMRTMGNDRCGDLEITHTGARSLVNAAPGTRLADCFKGG